MKRYVLILTLFTIIFTGAFAAVGNSKSVSAGHTITDILTVDSLSVGVGRSSDDGDDDGWSLLKVVVPTTPAAT